MHITALNLVSKSHHADVYACRIACSAANVHAAEGNWRSDKLYCLKIIHGDQSFLSHQLQTLSRLAQCFSPRNFSYRKTMPSILGYGVLASAPFLYEKKLFVEGMSNFAIDSSLKERKDSLYVITPWIGGITLSHLLHGSSSEKSLHEFQASLSEMLILLQGIASSLGCLASIEKGMSLVHRDIKPSNIILSLRPYPRVMFVDYDTAVFSGKQYGEAPWGTFAYAAPERILAIGDGVKVTADSSEDIFSFGVVAHEVLTGRWPHLVSPRKATQASFWRFHYQEIDALLLDEALPCDIRHLLAACLEMDPLRRPTARELVKHLGRLAREYRFSRMPGRTLSSVEPSPTPILAHVFG